jgi:hypothetical protein
VTTAKNMPSRVSSEDFMGSVVGMDGDDGKIQDSLNSAFRN